MDPTIKNPFSLSDFTLDHTADQDSPAGVGDLPVSLDVKQDNVIQHPLAQSSQVPRTWKGVRPTADDTGGGGGEEEEAATTAAAVAKKLKMYRRHKKEEEEEEAATAASKLGRYRQRREEEAQRKFRNRMLQKAKDGRHRKEDMHTKIREREEELEQLERQRLDETAVAGRAAVAHGTLATAVQSSLLALEGFNRNLDILSDTLAGASHNTLEYFLFQGYVDILRENMFMFDVDDGETESEWDEEKKKMLGRKRRQLATIQDQIQREKIEGTQRRLAAASANVGVAHQEFFKKKHIGGGKRIIQKGGAYPPGWTAADGWEDGGDEMAYFADSTHYCKGDILKKWMRSQYKTFFGRKIEDDLRHDFLTARGKKPKTLGSYLLKFYKKNPRRLGSERINLLVDEVFSKMPYRTPEGGEVEILGVFNPWYTHFEEATTNEEKENSYFINMLLFFDQYCSLDNYFKIIYYKNLKSKTLRNGASIVLKQIRKLKVFNKKRKVELVQKGADGFFVEAKLRWDAENMTSGKPTDVYLYEGIGQKKITDIKMTDVNYISYDMPIKVDYLSALLTEADFKALRYYESDSDHPGGHTFINFAKLLDPALGGVSAGWPNKFIEAMTINDDTAPPKICFPWDMSCPKLPADPGPMFQLFSTILKEGLKLFYDFLINDILYSGVGPAEAAAKDRGGGGGAEEEEEKDPTYVRGLYTIDITQGDEPSNENGYGWLVEKGRGGIQFRVALGVPRRPKDGGGGGDAGVVRELLTFGIQNTSVNHITDFLIGGKNAPFNDNNDDGTFQATDWQLREVEIPALQTNLAFLIKMYAKDGSFTHLRAVAYFLALKGMGDWLQGFYAGVYAQFLTMLNEEGVEADAAFNKINDELITLPFRQDSPGWRKIWSVRKQLGKNILLNTGDKLLVADIILLYLNGIVWTLNPVPRWKRKQEELSQWWSGLWKKGKKIVPQSLVESLSKPKDQIKPYSLIGKGLNTDIGDKGALYDLLRNKPYEFADLVDLKEMEGVAAFPEFFGFGAPDGFGKEFSVGGENIFPAAAGGGGGAANITKDAVFARIYFLDVLYTILPSYEDQKKIIFAAIHETLNKYLKKKIFAITNVIPSKTAKKINNLKKRFSDQNELVLLYYKRIKQKVLSSLSKSGLNQEHAKALFGQQFNATQVPFKETMGRFEAAVAYEIALSLESIEKLELTVYKQKKLKSLKKEITKEVKKLEKRKGRRSGQAKWEQLSHRFQDLTKHAGDPLNAPLWKELDEEEEEKVDEAPSIKKKLESYYYYRRLAHGKIKKQRQEHKENVRILQYGGGPPPSPNPNKYRNIAGPLLVLLSTMGTTIGAEVPDVIQRLQWEYDKSKKYVAKGLKIATEREEKTNCIKIYCFILFLLVTFGKQEAESAAAAIAAPGAWVENDPTAESMLEEYQSGPVEPLTQLPHDDVIIMDIYEEAISLLSNEEAAAEMERAADGAEAAAADDKGGGGGGLSGGPRRSTRRVVAWAKELLKQARIWVDAAARDGTGTTVWDILFFFNVYNQINAVAGGEPAPAAGGGEPEATLLVVGPTNYDKLINAFTSSVNANIDKNYGELIQGEEKSELFIKLGEELNKFLSPISTQSPRSPPAAGGGGGGQGEATEVDKAVAAWNYTNFQEVIHWLKSKDDSLMSSAFAGANKIISQITLPSAAAGGGGGGAVAAFGASVSNTELQDFKDLTLSIPLQQTALLFELIDKINNPSAAGGGGSGSAGSIELFIAQNSGLKAALQIKRRYVGHAPPSTWDQMWDTRTEFLYPTAAAVAAPAAAVAAPAAAVVAHKAAQTAFQTYFAENLFVPTHAVQGGGYKRQSRKRRRRKGRRTRQKQRKRQGKTRRKTRKRRRRRRRRTRRN